ncbi:MAG: DNA repair protein RadA [Rhodospirillales bacterium RIFCSPLOWO2_12_FULL_58_28]|nr:MAG: DNA repair protein RadA [Rhodospirillales bacterium RIFCSPLOWO2_02_FULL_58_16]OHC78131.1 MAG: DNA repair protein RadA [Rhodospirillales bacterium RIFCSPLOWO2_12_FULL_58_28]
MARKTANYVCQECGAASAKWSGRCDACGAWNTLAEETQVETAPKGLGAKKGHKVTFFDLEGSAPAEPRLITGIKEFDRVTGGGIVPGSALLIGGDPGIGKSTLLLQVTAALSASESCAYISGEESIAQLRMRALRLSLNKAPVQLATATSVRDIAASLDGPGAAKVVVIDSIQTMYVDNLESAPGSVGQVRASAQELIRLAKRRGFAVVLVGHVTKDGQIAGPRVLEHMVDTVLYFEGDRGHQFRILRAVKNRFGPTDEIGVFEMTDAGLAEVANPSALFLAEHTGDVSGSSVFAGMEGSRPMLVEIQSLLAPGSYSSPRRSVVGWDSGRLAMTMAVLETRCGLSLGASDVYLNVAGGLRINEPAADLAVAASLISAESGVPLPPETVIFGEIGLSGEVRSVAHTDQRLKEAAKLGFTSAIVPKSKRSKGVKSHAIGDFEVREVSRLVDLIGIVGASARSAPSVKLPATGKAGHG